MDKEDFCIDFTNEFHCLAGDCPYTCCKGWQIPVDDETYENYKAIPGIRGRAFRYHIINKDPKRIRRIFYRCPFHTNEGHCLHQDTGQTELMPVICKSYPRRVVDFGPFREGTMELSCPEVARIFLENLGRHEFVKAKSPQLCVWELMNDDLDFLSWLKDEREKILDYVWDKGPLYLKWESLYAYIYNQHDLFARDKIDMAKKVILTEDKEKQGSHALLEGRGYAFYSIKALDKMILEHLDYSTLFIRVPMFYQLIKRYLRLFSKMNLADTDIFFSKTIEEMCEKKSSLALKYKSYFSYLIQQEYTQAYESYSLIRELMLCILYTELLMLFDLTEYVKTGDISDKRQVEILYFTEHNVRHNPYLTKNLYSIIREELL